MSVLQKQMREPRRPQHSFGVRFRALISYIIGSCHKRLASARLPRRWRVHTSGQVGIFAGYLLPIGRNVLVLLFCSLIAVGLGCKKHERPSPVARTSQESNQAQVDVCGLITSQEIEVTQGSPIKETKNSARSDAAFRVSQCFYTAAE